MKNLLKILFVLGITAGLAFAQDIELEPITVTVSRRAKKLSETPASVSIISRQDIEQFGSQNIPDLLKSVEGVYTYDSSGVGSSGAVNLRGFYGGMSSHQLVLVDGIPQNKGKDKLIDWDLISLDNVESIEVLRGPASAMYGDNAMSGIINIITKKPTKKPQATLSSSYGNFSTQDYGISASGTYKQAGYVLDISHKTTDGFRRHCDYGRTHLGGKFDYAVNDSHKLRFGIEHYEKERGAIPWALTEAQVAQDRRQARPGTESDSSDEIKNVASITHNWDINRKLNSETAFYYKHNDAAAFYTSGSAESTKKEQLDNEDIYGILLKGNFSQKISGFEHKFTIGADLERDNFDYEEYKAPYQQRGDLQSDYEVIRDKIGQYFNDEIKLTEHLIVNGGFRYDRIDFDFGDIKTPGNSKTKKLSKVIPNCGAVYKYQKDSSIYVNYAEAFRAPTTGQMFTYGSSANPDLKPEEALNYETGLRHAFGDLLKLNMSFYWMELDDEIWYDYATSKYQNYGKTSHKGIEQRLDFKVNKSFSTFLNYTYSRAKNENGSYSGNYLTNIPIHKASLGLHFQTDFGLGSDLLVNYIGSSYLDAGNTNKLSGITTTDTKITYEYRGVKTFLAVTNLCSKEYNLYGYLSGSTRYFNPAPGRTFRLGVEYEF